MTISRTTSAALAAGVLALSLAACGDDGDSGGSAESEEFVGLDVAEIKAEVLADMKEAESVHLEGSFAQDGGEFAIDMGITADGDCAGSITTEGATADIIAGPDGTFLKGDQAFWDVAAPGQGDAIMSMLDGKWALVPATQAGSFSEICNLQNFIDELEDEEDEEEDAAEKGDTAEVNGEEALEIIGEDDETGDPTSVWVSTEAPHYILRVSSDSETEGGELNFTDYDEPVDTEAPDEDEYVDLSQPR